MRVRERSREEEGSVWERRIKRGPPGRGGGGGMQSPDIIFKSDTAKHFKADNNGEYV